MLCLCVYTDATIDMKVFKEETFGPVTPVFKFSTDDEAIQLANNTQYGLAAYFYTKVCCWDCIYLLHVYIGSS